MAYPQAPIKMDIYGAAARDSNQAWELQRTRFEAREEYLWPKTGWGHVEFIPC